MMNGGQRDGGFWRKLLGEAPRLASFGAVGVVNGVINYAVTVGLTVLALTPLGLSAEGWALGLVKAVGWLVAVTNSYVLNAKLTFSAESGGRLSLPTYARFAASGLAGLCVEVASFVIAARHLPLALAAIVPIGLAFLVNFAMARFFVFPNQRR